MTRQIQSKWAPGFVILALLAGSSLAQAAPDSADDSAPCSTAKLSGTYGYHFEGEIVGVAQFRTVGTQTFDGAGHIAVTASSSLGGQVSSYEFTGTYSLGADCRGQMEGRFPNGSTGHMDFVSVDGGRQLVGIQMDAGVLLTGTFLRR